MSDEYENDPEFKEEMKQLYKERKEKAEKKSCKFKKLFNT